MKLGEVLDDYAYANQLSGRELAAEIGIPHATVHRLCKGENVDSVTLAHVLTWLLSGQKVKQRRRKAAAPRPLP